MTWWRRRTRRDPAGDPDPVKTLDELAAEYGVDLPTGPSLGTRAMVAAANPDRTAEEEALIAEAREQARRDGTLEIFDQVLANMAAIRERDGSGLPPD